VSRSHGLDQGRLSGAGTGPIYTLPADFGRDDAAPGWLVAKVLWAWPPSLLTHSERVLVRGVRLDGPGSLRFELGPQWDTARRTGELHIVTSEPVGSFGGSSWGATVTLLFARTPGCYGLQLDSSAGTSTIVFAATKQ
jgi:hypothetical protein